MKAEQEFRSAFERLKAGRPILLPIGTRLSQSTVAREAGCDPSALRKSRYPGLVAEIQQWLSQHEPARDRHKPQRHEGRPKKRSAGLRLAEMRAQRDHLATLLVEADARILELSSEIERLQETSDQGARLALLATRRR